MRTVWILIIVILMAGLVPICEAKLIKKKIPLYKGQPGTKIGDIRINPKDGARMVWVPAGEFTMGGAFTEDEKPQRKVYLDGYWMYKYEVTVEQYRKFCKATKRKMPVATYWEWKENHPMENVSWQEAADYAEWAGVTLPTEAQWEKAARGTDGRLYPWGNDWSDSKCASNVETYLKSTQPVGSYPSGASPYGCMDMAGNVYEWCADWYDPNYYNKAPAKNPTGPSVEVKYVLFGDTYPCGRVLRGGSWQEDGVDYFLCAARLGNDPASRGGGGFRCAKNP